MPGFPFYMQIDSMDCGPSCLRMVAKFYGKTYTLQSLRSKAFLNRSGVSMLGPLLPALCPEPCAPRPVPFALSSEHLSLPEIYRNCLKMNESSVFCLFISDFQTELYDYCRTEETVC
jgi:hypothetical protein